MPHDPLTVVRNDLSGIPVSTTVALVSTFFEPLDVSAVNSRNIFIQWFLQPTNEDLLLTTFEVFRAFNREGPYKQVTALPAGQFYYVDTNLPAVSKWEQVWYLVLAILPDATLQYSDPNHMLGIPPGRVLAINEQARIVYRSHNGTAVMVYKKRREGARCPACWDAVEGISKDDACSLCFGTGFTQGYYSPIRTRCHMTPSTEQIDFRSHQHATATSQASMLRFPRVRPNDVLYEEDHGRWWYVGQLTPIEDNRILVAQEVSLKRADPHDKVVDLLTSQLADHLLLPVV